MKIKIVALILDTDNLVLYKEDGERFEIPQGDPRVKAIIDLATVPLSRNEMVEIDLERVNDYRDFEEKSSGLVKFFRVAKNLVKHIFTGEAPHVEPVSMGTVPGSEPVAPNVPNPAVEALPEATPVAPAAPTSADVADKVQASKPSLTSAVDQIMAQAKPVSDPSYKQSDMKSDETMIVTIGGKIIPGMENLEKQFAHAAKMGNTEGVTNFLKRIAAVIDHRGHSIDDLLRFMERGDLPISDDGSIIAYKRLMSKGDGLFVDVHSKNVRQRVGSFVMMDPSLVDPDRRNECSNGLHIARRGYLRSFSGDVLVMCKIAPEDVIAVPAYDSNKVRVCGYHILGQITGKDQSDLISDRPMTSEKGRALLTAALRGNHIERIEEVRITGQYGAGLVITSLVEKAKAPVLPKKADEDAAAFDDGENSAAAVDPTKVAAETVAAKADPAPAESASETRAEKITRLVSVLRGKDAANVKRAAAQQLVEIGKAAKKGLTKLGLSTADALLVNQWTEKAEAKPEPKEAKSNPPAMGESPAAKEVKADHAKTKSRRELIADLATEARKGDKNVYRELLAQKKAAKKGWSELGVNDFEAIQTKFEK